MGRHTTPGVEAAAPVRDEVLGWGAFSSAVAAVFVGVLAGWLEAFGVLVLGGLATAALWVARRTGAELGRGRHASDAPWSPSDLLDLKDADARTGTDPAREPAPHPGRARRRSEVPGPPGSDPLGWLPGAAGAAAPAERVAPAGPVAAVLPVQPAAGRSRSGRRAAGPPDIAPAGAVAQVPRSRRSLRAPEAAGGPTPPVLPVPAFVGSDPLAGPISAVALAAEPAVLDPALDHLREPDPGPGPVSARDRAAAAIDPFWERRARRPHRPRQAGARPAPRRRAPGPVEDRDHDAPGAGIDLAGIDPDRIAAPTPVLLAEPDVVVLPEPDVPEVLLLPERDAEHDSADQTAMDAAGHRGRPAPGTLGLDELLVLHTRRPAAGRGGSVEPAPEVGAGS